jgi:hypothetical protein
MIVAAAGFFVINIMFQKMMRTEQKSSGQKMDMFIPDLCLTALSAGIMLRSYQNRKIQVYPHL